MSVRADDAVYKEVVNTTRAFLGPAADRFVMRQIQSHLHKSPEQLQRKDLAVLIDWIGLAMRVLSDDEELVNKYVADLKALAGIGVTRTTGPATYTVT